MWSPLLITHTASATMIGGAAMQMLPMSPPLAVPLGADRLARRRSAPVRR